MLIVAEGGGGGGTESHAWSMMIDARQRGLRTGRSTLFSFPRGTRVVDNLHWTCVGKVPRPPPPSF